MSRVVRAVAAAAASTLAAVVARDLFQRKHALPTASEPQGGSAPPSEDAQGE